MNSRRTAILMLKYLLAYGKTEKDEEINALTTDDFERAFIPIAAYWSNDLIDVCFNALGIEQKEGAFNSDMRAAWYAWFEETVNNLVLENE